ncbi:enoyl-CoA hydratase/isomerase family protein [Alteromonadaceae bacterium BrNp21-10]|nr:enoyl-CoA hydratase/isomerase family protein [Alteromonadaceae bacterium BrNp21-10]
MSDKVLFSRISAANGKKIGHARLNKPQSLNALDIDMVRALMAMLLEWQQDPQIVAVFVDGAGEKAFCAGGDVVAMHSVMKKAPATVPLDVVTFFTEEYRLDYLIHTYAKPIIAWGSGVVMGGGLGLFAGASHRIVTETSRVAMPEISIGLYPDVGGSWFLNQMPEGMGLFLGLTAASVNAADMLTIKLADYFVADAAKDDFLIGLASVNWDAIDSSQQQKCTALCHRFQKLYQSGLPAPIVTLQQDLIAACTQDNDVELVVNNILNLPCQEIKWLQKAQKTLAEGSKLTAAIVFEQLQRAKTMTLADCFRMELTLSCRCAQLGEFQEGVRALLIDKDRNPKWQYPSIKDITPELITQCFAPLWSPSSHPLCNLEKS